jgi:hypothetical protein
MAEANPARRIGARAATIVVEQLPNGYWRGSVSITIPQLPAPHEQSNDLFHTADEGIVWARGVIDLLVRNV